MKLFLLSAALYMGLVTYGLLQAWHAQQTSEGVIQIAKDLPLFPNQLQELFGGNNLHYGIHRASRGRYDLLVSGISDLKTVNRFCEHYKISTNEAQSLADRGNQPFRQQEFKDAALNPTFPEGSFWGYGADPIPGNIQLYFRYSDGRVAINIWN